MRPTPYRAVLIGCGKIGSEFSDDPGSSGKGVCTHAAAFTACPDTELIAVCDADFVKAERCQKRWSATRAYQDPTRLLAEQTAEIVSVCTPDVTHYSLIRAAILTEGVKAVLAEKPLATSLGEAEDLVRLADERGILLAVNYSRRFIAQFAEIAEYLRGGELGKVVLVRGLYTKGTVHNGSHWFDLFRFLFGDVEYVCAFDRLREGRGDPTLDVQLETVDGVRGELSALTSGCFTVFEMDILAERGRIQITQSGDVVEFFEATEGVPFAGYRGLIARKDHRGVLVDVILHAVRDVVRCLQEKRRSRCSGSDAVAALRVALAAHESAKTGKPITVE